MTDAPLGRKLFDGKDKATVLQKLEEAFMLGSTDEEACIYAGISPSAFYAYQKKTAGFQKRKEALKNMPNLRAKKAIIDQFEADTCLAKWWLERRARLEFAREGLPF